MLFSDGVIFTSKPNNSETLKSNPFSILTKSILIILFKSIKPLVSISNSDKSNPSDSFVSLNEIVFKILFKFLDKIVSRILFISTVSPTGRYDLISSNVTLACKSMKST